MSEGRVIITSPARIASHDPLTPAERTLYTTFRTMSRYIWTDEPYAGLRDRGEVASDIQRAFRKTFTYPASKGAPANATIILAADDYFAMYVDGVLVQPPETGHDYRNVLGYNVPLPLVDGASSSTSLVLAFRVVNLPQSFAGLKVAVQVNYADPSAQPDIFYTGQDQSWLGEKAFDEHWEQPWFDAIAAQTASRWQPATPWASDVQERGQFRMPREEVMRFERLPALALGAQLPNTGSCDSVCASLKGGGNGGGGLGISVGAFAGILVGAVALSLALGTLVSFVMLRRHDSARAGKKGLVYEGVAVDEIRTQPGRRAVFVE